MPKTKAKQTEEDALLAKKSFADSKRNPYKSTTGAHSTNRSPIKLRSKNTRQSSTKSQSSQSSKSSLPKKDQLHSRQQSLSTMSQSSGSSQSSLPTKKKPNSGKRASTKVSQTKNHYKSKKKSPKKIGNQPATGIRPIGPTIQCVPSLSKKSHSTVPTVPCGNVTNFSSGRKSTQVNNNNKMYDENEVDNQPMEEGDDLRAKDGKYLFVVGNVDNYSASKKSHMK